MTRINCVPPSELHTKHLVAEYRELPRIFGLVEKAIARGEQPDPESVPSYRLGTGHVRFFYPRLMFLAERHQELVAEMQARGFTPTFTAYLPLVYDDRAIPIEWYGRWTPDESAIALNRARIADRMPKGT